MKTATLNIKLEQALYDRIKAEAERQNVSIARLVRTAIARKIATDGKAVWASEPDELEPHVKAALDKFILALFPLVGEFYATPTKMKALPEFHIYTEGKNIGIWPIYHGSPHFQYPPELYNDDD